MFACSAILSISFVTSYPATKYISDEMISHRARVKRDWMEIEEAKCELDGEDEETVREGKWRKRRILYFSYEKTCVLTA